MNNRTIAFSAPTALIANRDFKLPADGWMQLFPFGEVSGPIENPDGKKVSVVQVIDQKAADVVLASFRAESAKPNFGGVLVDFEHFSLDSAKESRAAAWIDDLQKRDDGVWFKPRITNSGKMALEGGDYRFISPVLEFPGQKYRPGERVRPIGLHSAGLTNDARIKGGVPLSNRNDNPVRAADENKPMKSVIKLLGLADDASEDSAVAAVQKIQNRATTAEGQVTALTTERDTLLAAQVESDLEQYKEVITNRDDVKAQLIANRAGTLKVLSAFKKPAASSVITNRQGAKPPGGKDAGTQTDEAKLQADEARAVRIANRAGELQATARSNGRSLSHTAAFQSATAEVDAAK